MSIGGSGWLIITIQSRRFGWSFSNLTAGELASLTPTRLTKRFALGGLTAWCDVLMTIDTRASLRLANLTASGPVRTASAMRSFKQAGDWHRRESTVPPLIVAATRPGHRPQSFRHTLRKRSSGNPRHRKYFDNLAPSYRRLYIAWIDSAKREETRMRRLEEAVGLLAAGKKLGLK